MSVRAAPSYAGRWMRLYPPLTPWLLSLLQEDMGFEQMTPVQASTIPLFLKHKDVVVEAVTGSGKTLAFVIPVLEMLMRRTSRLKKDEVGALIVSPTRELAEQIFKVVNTFLDAQERIEEAEEAQEEEEEAEEEGDSDSDSESDSKPARIAPRQPRRKWTRISGAQLVVGGSKSNPLDDYRQLRDTGPDILVGTPGRLEQLLQRKGVKKSELDVLILDEADRLLDLGFTEDLHRILALLPKQRRTGLFSATMTDALTELVRIGLRNPVRVVVKVEAKSKPNASKDSTQSQTKTDDSRRTPATLQNMFQVCRPENKLAQLIRIVLYEKSEHGVGGSAAKFIVYFSTCAQVNYFHSVCAELKEIKDAGVKMYALHGKQTAAKRKSQFDAFVASTALDGAASSKRRGGGVTVLLCTDVAARGLDLPDVDVVVQYDPPTDPKVFSHRCGRTARAGRRGRAIVMLHAGREEDLVAYMDVKRIPLAPYPYLSADLQGIPEPSEAQSDAHARTMETRIREMNKADRQVFDLSMRAYVSYVRAYSKHEMSYIFRLSDLDLAGVAHAFGMIRLPAMPELKLRKAAGMVYPEEQIDFAAISFKDKTKEKARLAKIEQDKLIAQQAAATAAADAAAKKDEAASSDSDDDDSDDSDSSSAAASASKKANKKRKKKPTLEGAWSEQKERRELRAIKKEKRAAKRSFLKKQAWEQQKEQQQQQQQKASNPKANSKDDKQKQRDEDEDEEDWDKEYRKLKKQKRARQSHAQPTSDTDGDTDTDANPNNDDHDNEPFFVL